MTEPTDTVDPNARDEAGNLADGCGDEHTPGSNLACAMAPETAAPAPFLRVAETPEVDPAIGEVAADLQNAVRAMRARAADADKGAEQMEESARRERVLADEYRAKAAVLESHLATLGIEAPAPDEAYLPFS